MSYSQDQDSQYIIELPSDFLMMKLEEREFCPSTTTYTIRKLRQYGSMLLLSGFCVVFIIVALYTVGYIVPERYDLFHGSSVQTSFNACRQPIRRQEWRTLTHLQRQEYISAVQCLQTQRSRIGLNHSLHDEFTWIHSRLGNFTHTTPAFVAWHRYFLHIYERTLREQCGYSGHLTYWDWSMDWKDMAKSPIWEQEAGFGGNGDKSGLDSVGHGHCVTDGPFANLTVRYFSALENPHCLSRGFLQGELLEHRFGARVQPDALEAILDEPDYGMFNLKLESGPHDAVPFGVRGDFSRETAPNDPVFYLHHTQLDRMWWMWQQRDPQKRLWQYGHGGDNASPYSLDDVFHLEGFAPDIKVFDLMSTESETFCYTY